MFDFWGDGLQVSNMTLGNFCNVDLDYRLKPELSIKKRGDAITQAHVAYCHGDKVVARNVRFISRLNMNPLNGARRILFDHCHMECTDDALTGNGVYLQCTFGFYGQKPFYTTHRCGAVFLDCDFYMQSQNSVMAFCKASGPLTIIDSRYHAGDSTYIAWANYPDATLRCYQSRFTLNGKVYTIGNRNPQNTTDISSQPLLNKGQRKVNIEHPQCRCMDKTQAAAFPYLRFILLNGESLYAGVFFITFFRTVRSCSDNFSYRICSCVHIRAVNTSR